MAARFGGILYFVITRSSNLEVAGSDSNSYSLPESLDEIALARVGHKALTESIAFGSAGFSVSDDLGLDAPLLHKKDFASCT